MSVSDTNLAPCFSCGVFCLRCVYQCVCVCKAGAEVGDDLSVGVRHKLGAVLLLGRHMQSAVQERERFAPVKVSAFEATSETQRQQCRRKQAAHQEGLELRVVGDDAVVNDHKLLAWQREEKEG